MENKKINTNEINRESWDAYQETYVKAAIAHTDGDYFNFFANGGICEDMSEYMPLLSLIGDLKGLKVLDTCCASDAWQAYSLHNMGAKVTAWDIAPKAIEIASQNAKKMGLDMEFVVADMQTLEPIADDSFDIVFAHYPNWVQDFYEACRTWHRVLKKGGKLLLFSAHSVSLCVIGYDSRDIKIRNYNEKSGKATWHDSFDGTPAADIIGGFHVDLPYVEHFWGLADMLNAICDANFCIKKVHEGYEEGDMLPRDFSVMAVKQ